MHGLFGDPPAAGAHPALALSNSIVAGGTGPFSEFEAMYGKYKDQFRLREPIC